jgi:hypothetical protein
MFDEFLVDTSRWQNTESFIEAGSEELSLAQTANAANAAHPFESSA